MDIPEIVAVILGNFDTSNKDDQQTLLACICVNSLWFKECARIRWLQLKSHHEILRLAKVQSPQRKQIYANCVHKVCRRFFEQLVKYPGLIDIRFDSLTRLYVGDGRITSWMLQHVGQYFDRVTDLTIKGAHYNLEEWTFEDLLNRLGNLESLTLRLELATPDKERLLISNIICHALTKPLLKHLDVQYSGNLGNYDVDIEPGSVSNVKTLKGLSTPTVLQLLHSMKFPELELLIVSDRTCRESLKTALNDKFPVQQLSYRSHYVEPC